MRIDRANYVPQACSVWHVPTTRRRHFGSVRKLPSGRYRARYWHAGVSHAAPETFGAKAEALAWLSTTETDLLRGSWVAPNAGMVKLGAYAKEWLEAHRHLRPRTVERYGYLLDCHVLPFLGQTPLVARP